MVAVCLVTGSHGFLGSALSKELVKQGCQVIILPRDMLLEPQALNAFVAETAPNLIFHCGAYGNKYDQTDESKIIMANIIGTHNLLEASRTTDYAAFLTVGSSSEYGAKEKPMKETDALDTDTYYGASKASSTLIARAFARKYQKPVVTVRPFSLYGPGDAPDHFIPTAIRSFKNDDRLDLSSGVHDWIYIDDMVNAMLRIALNGKRLAGKAVNVGTGVQTSNHAIISMLRGIFMKPGKVHQVEKLRSYDSPSWVADTSLMRSLGWKPLVDIEEGLQSCVYGME